MIEEIRRNLWGLDNYDLMYFEPSVIGHYKWTSDYEMFKSFLFGTKESRKTYAAALHAAKQVSHSNPDKLYRLKKRDPSSNISTYLMAGEVLEGFNPTMDDLKYLAKDPLDNAPF